MLDLSSQQPPVPYSQLTKDQLIDLLMKKDHELSIATQRNAELTAAINNYVCGFR